MSLREWFQAGAGAFLPVVEGDGAGLSDSFSFAAGVVEPVAARALGFTGKESGCWLCWCCCSFFGGLWGAGGSVTWL